MPAHAIWLGDLVTAIGELAPDEATIESIARVLGMTAVATSTESATPVSRAQPERPSATPDSSDRPSPSATFGFAVNAIPALAPRSTPAKAPRAGRRVELSSRAPVTPVAPPSLLSPLAGRFIVQELVVSSRFGPHIDSDLLVAALANGEIPQPVPLQERRTLARGVQILVDVGEGMEPFAEDRQMLIGQLRRLVGDALVDVRMIHEVPDPEDPIARYEPPPIGVPVLALTDLGLSGRVERGMAWLVDAWQAVAISLSERGSELVALVPYAREHWPATLTDCMRLAPWDRATTIKDAR